MVLRTCQQSRNYVIRLCVSALMDLATEMNTTINMDKSMTLRRLLADNILITEATKDIKQGQRRSMPWKGNSRFVCHMVCEWHSSC